MLQKSNPYLDDEELVENKYYQFKGGIMRDHL